MIDRDELAPEARALFDSARAALSPDDVAVRRVRARMTAAIAAGAAGAVVASADAAHGAATTWAASATHGVGAAATATSAASAATATSTSTVAAAIAGKLAAVVLAAGVAAGTGTLVARHQSRATRAPSAPAAPTIAVAAARAIDVDEPICDVRSAVPASAPTAVAPTAVAPAAPVEPPPARRRIAAAATVAAPAPAVAPLAPAAPAIASLARETELVDGALAALAHDRPDDALAALARYATETAGHGQLAEDAAALEIEARCRLGDARADDELAAFAVRWPRSTEHARLVAACRRDRGSETP